MRNSSHHPSSSLIKTAWIAVLSIALGAAPAWGAAENEEIQLLRQQLRLLEQRLAELERRQTAPKEETAAAPRPAAEVSAGASGFALASADKKFQFRFSGLLHADARFYGSDAPASDTFLLRRVRPTFQGTLNEKAGFRITPEFAGSNATLLDANVTYAFSPAVTVLVGKAKSPFDLERLVSGNALRFVERAYPTVLGPNRDIGVQISGELADKRLSYALGWLNGVSDNGSSVTNPDADTEIALRLFAQPFVNDKESPLAGLGFGVAFTHGDKSTGSPAGYSTLAQQPFFAWNAGVAQAGRHTRWSPQLTFFSGPFGLVASYVESSQRLARAGVVRTLTNEGYLLQGSYVLTGEKATLRGVTPAKPFALGGEGWGAFEIAARLSGLKIDRAAFAGAAADQLANPASSAREVASATLGGNWYLNRNLKFVINYEYTDFTGGGTGATGPGAVTAHNEHAVLARTQVSF